MVKNPLLNREDTTMIQTILLGSCVSVQGAFVQRHPDGRIVVRVGDRLFEGRPVNAAA